MNRFAEIFRRGFAENVRFGVNAIRDHKLRSGLTILGIVVGVTTVIAMVAIVIGFNNNVIGNFQAFGANRIEFLKYKSGSARRDHRRRRSQAPQPHDGGRPGDPDGLPECAAVSVLAGYIDEEIHVKNGSLETNSPYMLGVDEYYPAATAYTIALGRFFTPTEVEHGASRRSSGPTCAKPSFPPGIRSARRSRSTACAIASSASWRRRGSSSATRPTTRSCSPTGRSSTNSDFKCARTASASARCRAGPRTSASSSRRRPRCCALRRKIPFNKANDFEINTPDQLIGQFRAITGGVTGAMILIALISLVVGGVGVMNIMLVSVTQRTREIGIRKAVGAFRRDIVRQFLTEAITLTTIGGILGVVFGASASGLVRSFVPSLPTAVPAWSVLVGLLVSMSVGLFFGIYPAVKASRLDPIEALRYE